MSPAEKRAETSDDGGVRLTLHLDVKFSHLAFKFALQRAHVLQSQIKERGQALLIHVSPPSQRFRSQGWISASTVPRQRSNPGKPEENGRRPSSASRTRAPTGTGVVSFAPGSPAYLGALLVTLVGLAQALSGLPAAGGRVKGRHHLAGSISKSPLYAVSVVQLLNLGEQARKREEVQLVGSAMATRNSYA